MTACRTLKETTYEPPDENFIAIGAERSRCAEVLFRPFPRITESTKDFSPEQHKVRRLHPQRSVRLVVLSYGTTLFQGIF